MNWASYLFATLRHADFQKLTAATVSDLAHRMFILPLVPECMLQEARALDFVFAYDDRIVVGRQGRVGDVLGADHEFAREGWSSGRLGRENPYALAYIAPRGTPAPSLEGVHCAIAEDLPILLTRAHAGERAIDHVRTLSAIQPPPDDAWHAAVRSVAAQGGIRLFSDGQPCSPRGRFGQASDHLSDRELGPRPLAEVRPPPRNPTPPPPSTWSPPHDPGAAYGRKTMWRGIRDWLPDLGKDKRERSGRADDIRDEFVRGSTALEAARRLGLPRHEVEAVFARLQSHEDRR